MSTYRERREAKADRLRGWADKREAKAESAAEQADRMASAIPFGQPILVGHHSEGRDRRYRDRMHGAMDRSLADSRKASEMRSRADNIDAAAANAIYSDDPDAIEALTAKIERLEAERARIKAYNASCRRGERNLDLLDERQRADLISTAKNAGYMLGKKGEMPAYHLANLSGVINTAKKRLAALKRKADQ